MHPEAQDSSADHSQERLHTTAEGLQTRRASDSDAGPSGRGTAGRSGRARGDDGARSAGEGAGEGTGAGGARATSRRGDGTTRDGGGQLVGVGRAAGGHDDAVGRVGV